MNIAASGFGVGGGFIPPKTGDIVLDVKSYGAVGNGVSDDTTAINTAIAAAIAATTSGVQQTIYFPPGAYVISSTPWGVFHSKGIALLGAGSDQSFILVGTAVSGPVFAWSECWSATTFGANSMNYPTFLGFPSVIGLTISGNRTTLNTQVGLQFYDRNDCVWLEDVTFRYMTGQAIYIGALLNTVQAYMRESTWINIRCFNCGNAGVATVEINSAGAGDSTNEINVSVLNIYAPMNGPGLLISNSTANNNVRNLQFNQLRIEGLQYVLGGNAFTSDLLSIGSATAAGGVRNIEIDNAHLSGAYPGAACLSLNAPVIGNAPFFITYRGYMSSEGQAGGKGIVINFGRNSSFEILGQDVFDTFVTAGANAGTALVIDSKGQDQNWTTSFAGGRVLNEHGGTFGTGAIMAQAGGVGYLLNVGAGGSIGQLIDKTTGVSLNTLTGSITTQASNLAAGTIVSFIFSNTKIAPNDLLVLNHVSGGTVGAYSLNAQCGPNAATINIRNNTGGALAEAIVIGFALIKGAVT